MDAKGLFIVSQYSKNKELDKIPINSLLFEQLSKTELELKLIKAKLKKMELKDRDNMKINFYSINAINCLCVFVFSFRALLEYVYMPPHWHIHFSLIFSLLFS